MIEKKLRSHLLIVAWFLAGCASYTGTNGDRFNPDTDLFLAQFDSKTDVDDVHSVAGVATVLRSAQHANVNFHAVAGAYGIQEGLYVPATELFEMAFGSRWSDAHNEREQALDEVTSLVTVVLGQGGRVWVADAGQSDFTADWLRRVRAANTGIQTKHRVHVVQHADWNESVTSPDKLAYVREHARYHKIADGNVVGNGTPGLRTPSKHLWMTTAANADIAPLWSTARKIADRYNGVDGRYLNEAIQAGGMDFSDVVETWWILDRRGFVDADAFFQRFATSTTP